MPAVCTCCRYCVRCRALRVSVAKLWRGGRKESFRFLLITAIDNNNNNLMLITMDAIISHPSWQKVLRYLGKNIRSQAEEVLDVVAHDLLPEARRAGRCRLVARYGRSILHWLFTQMSVEKYIPLKYTLLKFMAPLEQKINNIFLGFIWTVFITGKEIYIFPYLLALFTAL